MLLNLPKGKLSGVCKTKVLILYARQTSSYEVTRSVSSTMAGVHEGEHHESAKTTAAAGAFRTAANLPKGELSGACKRKVLILYARQRSSYEGARSVSSTIAGVRADIRSVHDDRQRRVRLEYVRQRSSYCMQDEGPHTKVLWCRTCSACVPKGISLEVR
jgi:hypothetical protein